MTTLEALKQEIAQKFTITEVENMFVTVHKDASTVQLGKKVDGRKGKRNKRSYLNRYANTIAMDNLLEDVENFQLRDCVVYFYQTSKGHWRLHLHGYGVRPDNSKMFLYNTEDFFGLSLFNTMERTYARKMAAKVAAAIGADNQFENKAFKGAK